MAFVLGFSKLGSCVIMNAHDYEQDKDDIFFSDQEPYESHSDIAAELRLAAAIINRAIADATGRTSLVPFAKDHPERGRNATLDAKAWILDDSMEAFSFLWLAEHLDILPEQIDCIRGRVCKDD